MLPYGPNIIPFRNNHNNWKYAHTKSFYNNVHRSIYKSQKVEKPQMYIKTGVNKICHTYTVEYLSIKYGVDIDTCYNIDEPQSINFI